MIKPLFLLLSYLSVCAQAFAGEVEFSADHYERDLHSNTVRGTGHAHYQKGSREIIADKMEIDFNLNRAVAEGHVRIKESTLRIWCDRAEYYLDGREGTFEDATLVSGQLMMTGSTVRKDGEKHFVISDGTYSNCQLDPVGESVPKTCGHDWKFHGRQFDVTFEGYAHVSDALIYAKGLPILFIPYFVVPVKTKRQSGFIFPSFIGHGINGFGFTVPYYFALSPWQDLAVSPTLFPSQHYHLGLEYRYRYSEKAFGEAHYYLIDRSFVPAAEETYRNTGIGEWAIDLKNFFYLTERIHSRQTIKLLSNPYYVRDWSDLGGNGNLAALRSQISLSIPGETQVFTAKSQHLQPLTVFENPRDPRGVDLGNPVVLPGLTYSRTTWPFLYQMAAFELDARFSNFYRKTLHDDVPLSGTTETEDFDQNDFLRAGRRFQLEPTLVFNFPIASAIQLQPLLKAGSSLYHFDEAKPFDPLLPTAERPYFSHREYLQTEIPFSVHLSRAYNSKWLNYDRIAHIIQPRVIYASTLYSSPIPDHPFFSSDVQPAFDFTDKIYPFHFFRFEFINRFLGQNSGGIERFFLLQLSEQYNIQKPPYGAWASHHASPLEILGEWKVGNFFVQAQSNIGLEETEVPGSNPKQYLRQSDFSGGIGYAIGPEFIKLESRILTRANSADSDNKLMFSFHKNLPIMFNVGGGAEYSLKLRSLLAYEARFFLQNKPKSCWGLSLVFHQEVGRNPEIRLAFLLDFGSPGGLLPK